MELAKGMSEISIKTKSADPDFFERKICLEFHLPLETAVVVTRWQVKGGSRINYSRIEKRSEVKSALP